MQHIHTIHKILFTNINKYLFTIGLKLANIKPWKGNNIPTYNVSKELVVNGVVHIIYHLTEACCRYVYVNVCVTLGCNKLQC